MGELDMSGMLVILLLFAEGESLSTGFKYEGQQRRTLVKSMSQQSRAGVVFRPWLTQAEAAGAGSAQEIGFECAERD
jgi:hypothetical protein